MLCATCYEQVDEIDVALVFKKFGLMNCEVKDLQEVTVIRNNEQCKEMTKQKPPTETNASDSKCPIEMINKAEYQLMGTLDKQGKPKIGKWQQMVNYVSNFIDDEISKEKWQKQCESEKFIRNIICLFNMGDQMKYEITEHGFRFLCHRDNCPCEKKGETVISTCCVLLPEHLERFQSFQTWWKSYYHKLSEINIYIYEILLIR